MATQNQSNAQPRENEATPNTENANGQTDRGANLAPTDIQPEPFSEGDPFRTARIAETVSETRELLAAIQAEPTGFENLDEKEYRNLSRYASERAAWPQARQDGFTGILRLGRPIPPRNKRVL